MPYVLLRNKPAIEEKIIHIAHYLDLDDVSFNGFMHCIIKFRQDLDIPDDLAAIDITLAKKTLIGSLAVKDSCAGGNPIQFSEDQYSENFQSAVNGDLQCG